MLNEGPEMAICPGPSIRPVTETSKKSTARKLLRRNPCVQSAVGRNHSTHTLHTWAPTMPRLILCSSWAVGLCTPPDQIHSQFIAQLLEYKLVVKFTLFKGGWVADGSLLQSVQSMASHPDKAGLCCHLLLPCGHTEL